MWKSAFAATGFALLAGACASPGPTQADMAAAFRSRDEAGGRCKSLYSVGAERAQCFNAADNLYVRPFQTYPDLFDLLLAERLSVETREEHGEISTADAQLELAKVNAEVRSAALARANQSQALQIQQRAAFAASLPVTCTTNGNSSTCY